jgi:hypothetical protein
MVMINVSLVIIFAFAIVFRGPPNWSAFWDGAWVTPAIIFAGLVASLLIFWLRKPVRVTVDQWGIQVDQPGDQVKVAWADVVWSESSFDDLSVVLAQRDDPDAGPLAAVEFDMVHFTRRQRREILDTLTWIADEQAEIAD